MMKRTGALLLALLLLTGFSAGCKKLRAQDPAHALALPSAAQITGVTVTSGGTVITIEDAEQIQSLLEKMQSAAYDRESVNELPAAAQWTQLDFLPTSGTSTVFLFWDDGKLYLEQPYVGVYTVGPELMIFLNGLP